MTTGYKQMNEILIAEERDIDRKRRKEIKEESKNQRRIKVSDLNNRIRVQRALRYKIHRGQICNH